MNFREQQEEIEEKILSPYGVRSCNTKGRQYPIQLCSVRTEFQRDRDRILHSKSFRRLKHKTQVFISPEGDHYRTRLTHTLEVSQIARTISRALRLNEDLTEAIALGHDLGHTPFGHTGENVLNDIISFGFNHNEQSLRVVEKLEDGAGLNLTWEVRDGIRHHSGEVEAQSLEGMVVHIADRIAYINHDIDDAQRAGIITEDSLPKECIKILGKSKSGRINTMIINVIETSYLKKFVGMDKTVESATMTLRKFLFEKVYIGSKAKDEEKKAEGIIKALFSSFMEDPEKLPKEYIEKLNHEDKERVICDYIAGMTDRYAINKFRQMFIPSPWSVY